MRPFCRSREPLRATLTALILLALSLTLAGFALENPYLQKGAVMVPGQLLSHQKVHGPARAPDRVECPEVWIGKLDVTMDVRLILALEGRLQVSY
jgi:hypothetical protein